MTQICSTFWHHGRLTTLSGKSFFVENPARLYGFDLSAQNKLLVG
jgi:hypothetical protein